MLRLSNHVNFSKFRRSDNVIYLDVELILVSFCISGACCILCTHPYLEDSLSKARLNHKISILNRRYFQKRRVLTTEQDGIHVHMNRLNADGQDIAPGAYTIHGNIPIQRTAPCEQYPSAEVTIVHFEPQGPDIPYAESKFYSTPDSTRHG